MNKYSYRKPWRIIWVCAGPAGQKQIQNSVGTDTD